jgi:hypothetical protein
VDWQTDPLLREEITVARRAPRAIPMQYAWSPCAGMTLLTWKGHAVGAVYPDGRYWLKWRRREHAGTAASPGQARRFMARWLHAHRHLAPLLDADLPPKTLVPLQEFLRDYDTRVGGHARA